MGVRGPIPVPTKILEARGTARADRRRGEPEYQTGVAECPEWLSDTGRDEWFRVIEELSKVPGVIQRTDWSMLAAYCEAWSDYVSIVKECRGRPQEELIASGLASAKRKTSAELLRLAMHFGLSPSSRARVNAAQLSESQEDERESKFFGPKLHDPE